MNSFSESQKFRKWWVWAVALGSVILPLAEVGFELAKSKEAISVAVIPGVALPLLVLALFLLLRLRTVIDANGVSYQFLPFHLKLQVKSWEEIEYAYVRKYSPLGEFGGWGIRYSFGNGKAYNVSGNMGLQLVLKNGKKILIGTQRPDEITSVLRSLKRETPPAGTQEQYLP